MKQTTYSICDKIIAMDYDDNYNFAYKSILITFTPSPNSFVNKNEDIENIKIGSLYATPIPKRTEKEYIRDFKEFISIWKGYSNVLKLKYKRQIFLPFNIKKDRCDVFFLNKARVELDFNDDKWLYPSAILLPLLHIAFQKIIEISDIIDS